MPCNEETCDQYTPTSDGTCGPPCSNPCGVQFEKKVFPQWDTSRINAPTWERDRIMYYFDDYCGQPGVHTPLGGSTSNDPDENNQVTEEVQWGLSSDSNPYGGRICKSIPLGYWWENNDEICPQFYSYGNFGTYNTRTPPVKKRYWEHYPTEISFEPIRSDSWFYYLYKTENGVVGQPCHVMCFYMYTLRTTGAGDGNAGVPGATRTTTSYSTYFGIRKVPYDCECDPIQTYINYSLEDGKITPESDYDPYPLIWTCGTTNNRIAFSYPGAEVSADVEVRAYGIEGQDVGSDTLGSWKLMLNVAGQSQGELYTEIGPHENFLDSRSSGHRYHTELEVRNSSGTVLARLRATFRPFEGVGDGSRDDSKFKIKNVSVVGNDTNSLQENTTYELWGRMETNTTRYRQIGQVRFPNIVRSDIRPGIPITFHINEAYDMSPGDVGQSLSSLGFYAAWDGSRGISYMSPAGNGVWESRNTVVVRDYTLPGGTIIRMELRSYYDDDSSSYWTRWKILRVVRSGSGYEPGDGVNYTGQDVYYLYYPSADATNKVGIALMVSTTQDGEFSEGQEYLQVGDTVNGWTITSLKHTDEDFNMHIAEITDGTADFDKDTVYNTSSGIDIFVRAGWGIPDRAIIIGKYEFQRKEIVYSTAIPNPEVPFDGLDVVKPKLQAVIKNGKVSKVNILSPGKNLKDTNIEDIKIAIQYPPPYVNTEKYLEYIEDGVDPDTAFKKAKSKSAKLAKAEPVFTGGVLTDIKIINGGSGYSETTPPFVTVPYIARSYKNVLKPSSNISTAESANKELFDKSEAFKKLSTKSYSYQQAIDSSNDSKSNQVPVTNSEGVFSGKYIAGTSKTKTVNKSGFDYNEYSKLQAPVHAEQSNTYLKGPIKELLKEKNSQLYTKPKSGFPKENAQFYLPPSNSAKSSSKASKDYKNLKASIDKQTQLNVQSLKDNANKQLSLINNGLSDAEFSKVKTSVPSAITGSLKNTKQQSSSIQYAPPTSFNNSSIDQAKTIKVSVSNLDDGNYYGKQFKEFYKTYTKGSNNTFEKALNQIDAQYEADINKMWEMDLDENRTIIYDGAKESRVRYAFYNLPCATSKKIYLIKGYCPDPRQNTFMRVNIGVKVPFDYDNDRGPCKSCIYEDSAVMNAYDDLVDEYGASNVELADAWCQVYYANVLYAGQSDGQPYGIPRTTGYTLPYSSSYGFLGFNLDYIKEQYGPQYIYEGCRDYEFSGNLEILHDLSLETDTFVDAVNKYGNPYDFKCGRRYEDSKVINESAINNFIGAVDNHNPNAPNQLSDPDQYEEI